MKIIVKKHIKFNTKHKTCLNNNLSIFKLKPGQAVYMWIDRKISEPIAKLIAARGIPMKATISPEPSPYDNIWLNLIIVNMNIIVYTIGYSSIGCIQNSGIASWYQMIM